MEESPNAAADTAGSVPGTARKPARTGLIIALLVTAIMLSVCNLAATAYLVVTSRQAGAESSSEESEPLPSALQTNRAREDLLEQFRERYNDRDTEALYLFLDPIVRVDVPREQFDQEMGTIYLLAGRIDHGAYSHFEYQGFFDGRKWFLLYYRVATDQGPGTLAITVAVQGDETYSVVGFTVNRP